MDADYGNAERSAPQVMGATFIGSASQGLGHDTMMRLREGTGGAFANIAMAKKTGVPAIKHDRCFATSSRVDGTYSGELTTQIKPEETLVMGAALPDTLYIAPTIVIADVDDAADFDERCDGSLKSMTNVASTPMFADVMGSPDEITTSCIKPGMDAGRSNCGFAPTLMIISDNTDFNFPGWFSGEGVYDGTMNSEYACQAACAALDGCDYFSYEWETNRNAEDTEWVFMHECYLKEAFNDPGCREYSRWGTQQFAKFHASGPRCLPDLRPAPAADGPARRPGQCRGRVCRLCKHKLRRRV